MLRRGNATFVGFGFGAIQAGLFCLEATQSGAFRHLVVAEIVPEIVSEVRAAGGLYTVNVAHADHVEAVTAGPVQLENPEVYADRARLVEAIAAAQEIATAVPNVSAYRRARSLARARGADDSADEVAERLAGLYTQMSAYDAAAAAYDTLLAKPSMSTRTWRQAVWRLELGEVLVSQRRPDQAVEVLLSALPTFVAQQAPVQHCGDGARFKLADHALGPEPLELRAAHLVKDFRRVLAEPRRRKPSVGPLAVA